MEDRIVNKDGDAFLKIRCIYQDTVCKEANLVKTSCLYSNEGYGADLSSSDSDVLKYPYGAVSSVGLDTVFVKGRLWLRSGVMSLEVG